MNNAERIAKIRARVEKATGGPWIYDSYAKVFGDKYPEHEWDFYVCSVPHVGGDDTTSPQNRADAEFISHAREDIPFLLSLVEFQANQLDASSEVIRGAPWYKDIEILQEKLDEAHSDLEQLALDNLNEIGKMLKFKAALEKLRPMTSENNWHRKIIDAAINPTKEDV